METEFDSPNRVYCRDLVMAVANHGVLKQLFDQLMKQDRLS